MEGFVSLSYVRGPVMLFIKPKTIKLIQSYAESITEKGYIYD